jgi:hypothetical protein
MVAERCVLGPETDQACITRCMMEGCVTEVEELEKGGRDKVKEKSS